MGVWGLGGRSLLSLAGSCSKPFSAPDSDIKACLASLYPWAQQHMLTNWAGTGEGEWGPWGTTFNLHGPLLLGQGLTASLNLVPHSPYPSSKAKAAARRNLHVLNVSPGYLLRQGSWEHRDLYCPWVAGQWPQGGLWSATFHQEPSKQNEHFMS